MATSEISPSIIACNSSRTARSSDSGTRLVRVTHPFHPLSGRQLVCVGERYNRYGTRLLLRIGQDHVCSVPRQWTDVVAPDPEVVIGEGRALIRVADLLGLADLVSHLVGQERQACERKANDVACVRQTMPPFNPRRCDSTDIDSAREGSGTAPELDSSCQGGVIKVTK
jgi:hypothetical protein